MKPEKFLPYAKQSIDQSDIEAVTKALQQELITRNGQVAQFEKEFAAYCGTKWAVMMSSGTAALYGAFQAARVSAFDRFITTPNTFIATAAAGTRLGARPVFVDIDRESGNMSLDSLKEVLSQPISRGRFVIAPVHFAGIAVDMQKMDAQLKSPDVVVIEDAAHAIGSLYPDGSKVGSCLWSQMTIFSFHPAKTMTTGEGGCVTTNDDELYRRLLLFRNSGMEKEAPYIEGTAAPWYYEVHEVSGVYHATEMQAALGLSQLKRLDSFVQKRRQLVKWYRERFAGSSNIRLFNEAFDERSAYHLMVVQIDGLSRTGIMDQLREKGIGSQCHYIPLYHQPVIKKMVGNVAQQFPEMEGYYRDALSLPLFFEMEEQDVEYVCTVLKEIVKG
ncbi:MAG: aminotransferase class V-fold PLP-dependent enzyme [Verrucomicrobia bacterium]|nr:aminotransferase class V-fold PLP-dependent enzyme [Verrucomicrobiota bacterium]